MCVADSMRLKLTEVHLNSLSAAVNALMHEAVMLNFEVRAGEDLLTF